MAPVHKEGLRTEQVAHGLLKQKSKRLLDGVLKKRMVLDATMGYGDEFQYNNACRSLFSTTGQLSSVLQGLHEMRQRRFGNMASSHDISRKLSSFMPPASPFVKLLPRPDQNANYIPGGFSNRARTMKPPIFELVPSAPIQKAPQPPPVQTKDTARQAISSVLSQSLGFLNFSGMSSNGNVPAQPSRNVPIVVESRNKTAPPTPPACPKSGIHRENRPKCSSSVYIPISNKTEPVSNQQSLIDFKVLQADKLDGIRIPATRHARNSNNVLHNQNERPCDFVEQPVIQMPGILPNGSINPEVTSPQPSQAQTEHAASKFRIKKIRIANTPQSTITKVKVHSAENASGDGRPSVITENMDELQSANQRDINKIKLVSYQSHSKANQGHDDLIDGMTLKSSPNADSLGNNVADFRNRGPVPVYENKIVNKHSHPQAVATPLHNLVHRPPSARTETNDVIIEKTSPTKPGTKSDGIPRFYFPQGKPKSNENIEETIQRISEVCSYFEGRKVPLEGMTKIAKACNLPMYWKGPLFHSAVDDQEAVEVQEAELIKMWKRIATNNHDLASKFVALLAKPGKNCLDFEDFLPLLRDIIDTHPGLIFLRDASEFHTRYMNTVIARIFYVINRSWSGQISASELRKSNFLTVLSLLEEEDDINAITDYFSYEHFYVIYCKFWELDTDHDLVIDKHDLIGYGDGVLSSRLIERVLSGAVTRWDTSDHHLGRMSYVDFVWFILSEEDKKTPTSIEYWFRCMDLDGDGCISMYEMEYFYDEQSQKLEQLDIEPLPFEDCVCQIFDIVNPSEEGKISLRDLKKCKMAHVFYDTFFNVAKYLNNEQKDPFAGQNSIDGSIMIMSDWDSFAAEEYELLVAEEQSSKLADMSETLLENDDEGIEVLEGEMGEGSHMTDGRMRLRITHSCEDDDPDADFADINFVDPPKVEKVVHLTRT